MILNLAFLIHVISGNNKEDKKYNPPTKNLFPVFHFFPFVISIATILSQKTLKIKKKRFLFFVVGVVFLELHFGGGGKMLNKKSTRLGGFIGDPRQIRTAVTAVKGRCPRPLDEGNTSLLFLICGKKQSVWTPESVKASSTLL